MKRAYRKSALFCFLICLACLFISSVCEASFTTTLDGETLTYDFAGISAYNWRNPNWILDPPYGDPITFSATITVSQPGFNTLTLYYKSDCNVCDPICHPCGYDTWHKIIAVSSDWNGPRPTTISTAVSFYIPASAKDFSICFLPAGSSTLSCQDIAVTNTDPSRANLLGGDDINPDTAFCDENGHPRTFHNKRGAGPGG